MSKVLLRSVRIVDPRSAHDGQTKDLLLHKGKVEQIGTGIEAAGAKVIEHPNLHLSPGWCEIRAHFHDPGHEEREDLESGIRAAIAGGYTTVALRPDTTPAVDSKADIEYILRSTRQYPVAVFPLGSISRGMEGHELSEMYDMWQAGAAGFSQGQKALPNAALLRLALQYAREFAPPLHLFPQEASLSQKGQMHEGPMSTRLGLRGIPAMSEEISLLRDLHLATYAETEVHFCALSAAGSVDILRQARQEGRTSTADVSVAHLLFTDEQLKGYDTNYKLETPLRSEEDRQALINGLRENVIQVISSDHLPVDVENKKCEFDRALPGMIGLQTSFGALGRLRKFFSLSDIVRFISINPREILRLPVPTVAEGQTADFSLFDPDEEWILTRDMIESQSHNTPLLGQKLTGRPLGIINRDAVIWLGQKV